MAGYVNTILKHKCYSIIIADALWLLASAIIMGFYPVVYDSYIWTIYPDFPSVLQSAVQPSKMAIGQRVLLPCCTLLPAVSFFPAESGCVL